LKHVEYFIVDTFLCIGLKQGGPVKNFLYIIQEVFKKHFARLPFKHRKSCFDTFKAMKTKKAQKVLMLVLKQVLLSSTVYSKITTC
jgi:hypothetical protein